MERRPPVVLSGAPRRAWKGRAGPGAGLFHVALACALAGGIGCASPDGPPWVQVPTDGVPGRWGQVAVYDGTHDRMLVFGGESVEGKKNDVWALDLAHRTWSRMDTKEGPGPRSDLASVLDTAHHRWIFVGGRVGLATSIVDVWSLDLESGEWKQLANGPSPRHDIPSATDGKRAWIFGGAGDLFQSLDDLWELDLTTDLWQKLPASGLRPTARTSCALGYYDGSLYMHGGHDVAQVFKDSWRYDLSTQEWSRLDVAGEAAANAHFGYAVDPLCGRMVLSGGDNLDNFVVSLSESLVFEDPARFVRLPASNLPPPRDHATLVIDPVRRDLVLYGGGALGDGLDTFSDAWIHPLGECP